MDTSRERGQSPGGRFDANQALVIGVNTYGAGVPGLATAVADATAVARVLGERHDLDVELLVEGAATRAALRAHLQRWQTRLTAQSRVVLYLACHGISQPSDGVRPDGFLLLADAVDATPDTYLPMAELYDALARLPCRHVLVVLDCCFAGMFTIHRGLGGPVPVYRERFDHFVDSAAWQVLASAAKDQLAFDSLPERQPGRDGHSPFAAALLDALDGAADLDGDGLVTATELYWYVRNRVERRELDPVFRQTPNLLPLPRHEHGEFVFQVADALRLPPAPVLTAAANPYRDAVPFREGDARTFFGRDAEVADLLAKATTLPLTVVSGPTGAGKSSLVHAGLVPALRGLAGWQVVLLDARTDDVGRWHPSDARTLAVIDHVEHALATTADLPRRLAALLVAGDHLHLVLVARADVEATLRTGPLSAWWSAGQVPLQTPGRAALREIVARPARDVVMVFEPDSLVETLLDQVIALPAPLPVLSAALAALYRAYWNRQRAAPDPRDRALRAADHPGLDAILARLGDRAVAPLAADERAVEAGLMPRFFEAEADGGVRTRRVRAPELSGSLGAPIRARLLERWARGWLFVVGTDDRGTYLEPQHAAVLAWWKARPDEAGVDRELVATVIHAARTWRDAGSPRDAHLWDRDPSRLARVELLTLSPALVDHERAFVHASVRRRDGRHRAWAAGVVALAAVVAIIAALVVARRADDRRARRRAEIARAGEQFQAAKERLAREPEEATRAALAAVATAPDDDPLRASYLPFAMALVARSPSIVGRLPDAAELGLAAFHRDGTRVATQADDAPRVWVGGPAWREVPMHATQPGWMTDGPYWSPDGGLIVAVMQTGSDEHPAVVVWDVAGRERARHDLPRIEEGSCVGQLGGFDHERVVFASVCWRRDRATESTILALDLADGAVRTIAPAAARGDVRLGPRFAALYGPDDVAFLALDRDAVAAPPRDPVSARALAFSTRGDRVYVVTRTVEGHALAQRRVPDLTAIGEPVALSDWLDGGLELEVELRVAPDPTGGDLVVVSGSSSRTGVYREAGDALHLVGEIDGRVDLRPNGDTLVVRDHGVEPSVVRSIGGSQGWWYARSPDRPVPTRWVGSTLVPAGILGVDRDGTVESIAVEPGPDASHVHALPTTLDPRAPVPDGRWLAPEGSPLAAPVPLPCPDPDGDAVVQVAVGHERACRFRPRLEGPASLRCVARAPERCSVIRIDHDARLVGLTEDERFATFSALMGVGVVALAAGAGITVDRWYVQPTTGSGRRLFAAALSAARTLTVTVETPGSDRLASTIIHLPRGAIRVTSTGQAVAAAGAWLAVDLERLPVLDDVLAISDDARLAAFDGALAPAANLRSASPGRAVTVFDLVTGLPVMVQPYDERPVEARITADELVTLSADGAERRWSLAHEPPRHPWLRAFAARGWPLRLTAADELLRAEIVGAAVRGDNLAAWIWSRLLAPSPRAE